MTLLNIKDLKVSTSDGDLLIDGLNLSLEQGDRLGVVGESGSGKSLMALCILGLAPSGLNVSGNISLSSPSGEIVDVISSTESTLNAVRGSVVSLVFQEPGLALNPMMKVSKQLSHAIRRHQGLDRRGASLEVLRTLDEVHISNPERVANSYPHEISGGERQRVAISLALACRPSLLIADEPTTSLDVSVQSGIIQLLDEIVRERKMSLIFISHDLAVISQIVEQVQVLQKGVTVERASIGEILTSPSHEYTKSLVESAKRLDRMLDANSTGRRGQNG